jgi:hypothetical protein
MNALKIIETATAEGLVVDLSKNGSLKVVGDQETVCRWHSRLKQHKTEIINLLSRKTGGEVESARPLPKEYRINCPSPETISPVKRVQGNQLTEEHQAYFMAAWPWIKENRTQLVRAGWTMAELLRRAKYRWPLGPWGLAWLPIWSKPGLVVELGTKGEIVFTYHSGGRTIRQTAWPN